MTDPQHKTPRTEVRFTVNGDACSVTVYPMERLLDVLRCELGLTGTKEGCGEGECGSCAVLLNGELVNSCLVPILLKEYFSQIESEKPVATESERMAECAAGKSLI